MDVFSAAFTSKKKYLLSVLCGLTLVNSFSYATTSCPDLNINAICLNGAWQVNIAPKDGLWELMGEGVNGKPCSNNVPANELFWNYAFSSARMGLVGCNYSLYDISLRQIGFIQVKSTKYIRTGSNWEKESYPGNWSCHESQDHCLFLP
jgi:hypothetical protein